MLLVLEDDAKVNKQILIDSSNKRWSVHVAKLTVPPKHVITRPQNFVAIKYECYHALLLFVFYTYHALLTMVNGSFISPYNGN